MSEMLNYVKVEEFRHLLVTKLKDMGLKQYLDVATDQDITNIMILANELLQYMREKEDKDMQIELLITYIVGLWARLLILHGDNIQEL
jgi:hypothetical protein